MYTPLPVRRHPRNGAGAVGIVQAPGAPGAACPFVFTDCFQSCPVSLLRYGRQPQRRCAVAPFPSATRFRRCRYLVGGEGRVTGAQGCCAKELVYLLTEKC